MKLPSNDAPRKLEFVIGNVGRKGEYRTTPTGKEVFGFSVARPVSFSQDAPAPQWFEIAVWDKSIAAQLEDRIYAGARVAVVGPVRVNEKDGKTYRNMDAYRIGFVEFIFPSNDEFADKVPDKVRPAKKEEVPEDDDLDF